ncbi:hypothetical protein AVEN_244749-1 [Araneus ventricosus]|uniref:Uncharacterized protein n=1 Tax=Araneus ventricosus TaxID=182803 RepID=A0A4Y2BTY7_ARAVE|nr:hypothetical protein AVEN_244749-1 [Araneus ventricosus]
MGQQTDLLCIAGESHNISCTKNIPAYFFYYVTACGLMIPSILVDSKPDGILSVSKTRDNCNGECAMPSTSKRLVAILDGARAI